MRFKRPFLAINLILVGALSGCVNINRQPLAVQNRQEIQGNQTIVNTTQKNIVAQGNYMCQSASTGYIVKKYFTTSEPGLLEEMVAEHETSVNDKSNQAAIAPVRTQLGNFNYMNYFTADLKKNLSNLSWLKLSNITTQYNIKADEQTIVNAAQENTTLFVGTTYLLNPNFENLVVTAQVKLDKKQKNKSIKTLYQNNFYYIYRLPVSKNKSNENLAIWTKNNALFLKEKLGDASAMLSKQ